MRVLLSVSLVLLVACSAGSSGSSNDGHSGGGKADGPGAEEKWPVTKFECRTKKKESGKTAAIEFDVQNWWTDGEVDLVWPEEGSEEVSPIAVSPESSRVSALVDGIGNGYVERQDNGNLRIWSDSDGIDFGTVILYADSDFESGYVRIENTLGDPGFYSTVDCELTQGGTVITGPVAFDLPLFDEEHQALYSQFNDDLTKAGYEAAPDSYRITGDEAGYDEANRIVAEWSEAADALSLPGAYLAGSPSEVLCFVGDAAQVPAGMNALADNVFSDMLIISASRTAAGIALDDSFFEDEADFRDQIEPLLSEDDLAAWNDFDESSGAVAVIWTQSDGGDNPSVTVIQPCAE